MPLEENINRLETEGDEARNVEDAITMLRYALDFFHIDLVYFHSTLLRLPSASVFIKHAIMISLQTLFQIIHVSRMTEIGHIIGFMLKGALNQVHNFNVFNSADPYYHFHLVLLSHLL